MPLHAHLALYALTAKTPAINGFSWPDFLGGVVVGMLFLFIIGHRK